MQALQKYKPFKAAGDDFSNSNPIFAFYFYRYFFDIASDLCANIDDPLERNEVEEELKATRGEMEKMQVRSQMKMSDEQNMNDILDYTELMFAKNQHQFGEGFRNKQMAEVVKHFHGVNQQQNKRRVFAKKRFIEIMKELKNKPEKKEEVPPPPPPKPIEEQIKKSVFQAPLPKPSNVISYDKIQTQIEANKRLENAISQLSFDRYKFAKEEVLHALSLLQQLSD